MQTASFCRREIAAAERQRAALEVPYVAIVSERDLPAEATVRGAVALDSLPASNKRDIAANTGLFVRRLQERLGQADGEPDEGPTSKELGQGRGQPARAATDGIDEDAHQQKPLATEAIDITWSAIELPQISFKTVVESYLKDYHRRAQNVNA